MSLIGTHHDQLEAQRQSSLQEEGRIDRTTWLIRWQRPGDVTRTTLLERTLGLVIFPLMLLWTFLFAMMVLGLAICMIGFQMLGRLFSSSSRK